MPAMHPHRRMRYGIREHVRPGNREPMRAMRANLRLRIPDQQMLLEQHPVLLLHPGLSDDEQRMRRVHCGEIQVDYRRGAVS